MIKTKKLSHEHFSIMDREIQKSLIGAVWQENKLYIEFESEINEEPYVSLFEADEDNNIRSTHRCISVEGGKCCWHLAVAHKLLEALLAKTVSTTDIAVNLRNISYPPPGGKDCTGLITEKRKNFTKLVPDGVWHEKQIQRETAPKEDPAVISLNKNKKAKKANNSPEHEDDRWLFSLNLAPAVLERVLGFRGRQRQLLKNRKDALKRVPNLGGDDPVRASMACFVDPEGLNNIKRISYFGDEGKVEESLTPLLFHENWNPVLLTGNTSTGKTVLAYFLARILMLPVTVLSGTLDTNEEKLIGFRDIKPLDGSRFVTVHVPGALLEAIKQGDMLIFNEINIALPEVLSILNDILDWQKRTYVSGVGEIKVAENFRLTATMNPGYVGTTELNLAFSSRFHHVDIKYPSKEVLKDIIMEEAGTEELKVPPEVVTPLVKIYDCLRQRVESGELDQEVLSIRSFIRAALNIIIRDGDRHTIVFNCLVSGVRDENSRQIIKDITEAFSFSG